jgi:hypothetical protein
MAKLTNPFNSFGAHGSIGRALSVRRRQKDHIAQDFPTHRDANTPPQQAQRLMFQMCRDLWHTLSQGEQAAWESLARPFHMTGYAYYLSQCLRPNPGIYLPLAGGTMQGAVNMDANRITDLPAPGANSDPARKTELDAHALLETGVHALSGFASFRALKSSDQSIPSSVYTQVTWQSTAWNIGSHFDTSNNRLKPTTPGYWLLSLNWRMNNMNNGQVIYTRFYKNGGSYSLPNNPEMHDYENKMERAVDIIYFNGSTDYVHFYLYHTSPVSRDLDGSTIMTWWTGFLIPQSG